MSTMTSPAIAPQVITPSATELGHRVGQLYEEHRQLSADNEHLLDENQYLRRQLADYEQLKRAMGALRTTINELLGDA